MPYKTVFPEEEKKSFFGIGDKTSPTPEPAGYKTVLPPIEGAEPEEEKSTLGALGQAVTRAPENVIASGITAIQGAEGASVTDRGIGDKFVNWVNERNKEVAREYEGAGDVIPGIITKQELATMGQNIGFSLASLGGSFVGGKAGMGIGAAGGAAVGGPLAPVTGPIGAAVGGVAGAMAGGGATAYRMQGYQQMQDWLDQKNEESIRTKGRRLTPQEEEVIKTDLIDMAKKSGTWEAIPEAVGNTLDIAILQGRNLLKKKGGAVGAVAAIIPESVLLKVGRAIAKLGGVFSSEMLTETITQHGQHNNEIDAGMSDAPRREWTNAEDLLKSAKEVLGPTLLLTGFLSGASGGYNMLQKRLAKDPTQQEIAKTMVETDQKMANDLNDVAQPSSGTEDQAILGAESATTQQAETPAIAPETEVISKAPEAKKGWGIDDVLGKKSKSALESLMRNNLGTEIGRKAELLWAPLATNAERLMWEKEKNKAGEKAEKLPFGLKKEDFGLELPPMLSPAQKEAQIAEYPTSALEKGIAEGKEDSGYYQIELDKRKVFHMMPPEQLQDQADQGVSRAKLILEELKQGGVTEQVVTTPEAQKGAKKGKGKKVDVQAAQTAIAETPIQITPEETGRVSTVMEHHKNVVATEGTHPEIKATSQKALDNLASIQRKLEGKPSEIEITSAKKTLTSMTQGKVVYYNGSPATYTGTSSKGLYKIKMPDGSDVWKKKSELTIPKVTDQDVLTYLKDKALQDLSAIEAATKKTPKTQAEIEAEQKAKRDKLIAEGKITAPSAPLGKKEKTKGGQKISDIDTGSPLRYVLDVLRKSPIKTVTDAQGRQVIGTKPGHKSYTYEETNEIRKALQSLGLTVGGGLSQKGTYGLDDFASEMDGVVGARPTEREMKGGKKDEAVWDSDTLIALILNSAKEKKDKGFVPQEKDITKETDEKIKEAAAETLAKEAQQKEEVEKTRAKNNELVGKWLNDDLPPDLPDEYYERLDSFIKDRIDELQEILAVDENTGEPLQPDGRIRKDAEDERDKILEKLREEDTDAFLGSVKGKPGETVAVSAMRDASLENPLKLNADGKVSFTVQKGRGEGKSRLNIKNQMLQLLRDVGNQRKHTVIVTELIQNILDAIRGNERAYGKTKNGRRIEINLKNYETDKAFIEETRGKIETLLQDLSVMTSMRDRTKTYEEVTRTPEYKAIEKKIEGLRKVIDNAMQRTISFTDHGIGMTPQVVAKYFLTVAEEGTKGEEESGAQGIGKAVILGWPTKWQLDTVAIDPVTGIKLRTVFDGDAESFLNGEMDNAVIESERVPDDTPTGTTFTFTPPTDADYVNIKNEIVKKLPYSMLFASTLDITIEDENFREGEKIKYRDYRDGPIHVGEVQEPRPDGGVYIKRPNGREWIGREYIESERQRKEERHTHDIKDMDTLEGIHDIDNTYTISGNTFRVRTVKLDPAEAELLGLKQFIGALTGEAVRIPHAVTNKGVPLNVTLAFSRLQGTPDFKVYVDFIRTEPQFIKDEQGNNVSENPNYPFLQNRTEIVFDIIRKMVVEVDKLVEEINKGKERDATLEFNNALNRIKPIHGIDIFAGYADQKSIDQVTRLVEKNKNIITKFSKLMSSFVATAGKRLREETKVGICFLPPNKDSVTLGFRPHDKFGYKGFFLNIFAFESTLQKSGNPAYALAEDMDLNQERRKQAVKSKRKTDEQTARLFADEEMVAEDEYKPIDISSVSGDANRCFVLGAHTLKTLIHETCHNKASKHGADFHNLMDAYEIMLMMDTNLYDAQIKKWGELYELHRKGISDIANEVDLISEGGVKLAVFGEELLYKRGAEPSAGRSERTGSVQEARTGIREDTEGTEAGRADKYGEIINASAAMRAASNEDASEEDVNSVIGRLAGLFDTSKMGEFLSTTTDITKWVKNASKKGRLYGKSITEGRGRRDGSVSETRRKERDVEAQETTAYNTKSPKFEAIRTIIGRKKIAEGFSLILKEERQRAENLRSALLASAKTWEVKHIQKAIGLLRKGIEAQLKAGDVFDRIDNKKKLEKLESIKESIEERGINAAEAELKKLDEWIDGLDNAINSIVIPKVFELDTETKETELSLAAEDLGRINGYEVIWIKDNTGGFNAFVNKKSKQIFIDRSSDLTPLELVAHELSHVGAIGHATNEQTQEHIDTESKAFNGYWDTLESFAGEPTKERRVTKEEALIEYAADLQAGIKKNYGIVLNEGLKPDAKIDVIATMPTRAEKQARPEAERVAEKAEQFVTTRNTKQVNIARTIAEYEKQTGRKFKFSELTEVLDEQMVEVVYDSSRIKNKNNLTEFDILDNNIYVNTDALKGRQDVDRLFENQMAFQMVMVLVKRAETRKGGAEKIKLLNDLMKLKESLQPHIKYAPPRIKKIFELINRDSKGTIDAMLGYITDTEFAKWLDTIPDFTTKKTEVVAPEKGQVSMALNISTMWQRLKEIVLSYIDKVTKTGRTKLDTLSDILDRYVYTDREGIEIAGETLKEARKFDNVEDYIKDQWFTPTNITKVVRGVVTNEYRHKNIYRYEPQSIDEAITGHWNENKETRSLIKRIKALQEEKNDGILTEDTIEGREGLDLLSDLENRLSNMLMPITAGEQKLRNDWATAHGIGPRPVFKQWQKKVKDQAEVSETAEGSPNELLLLKMSEGITLANVLEYEGQPALPPTIATPPTLAVDTLDKKLAEQARLILKAEKEPQAALRERKIKTANESITRIIAGQFPNADNEEHMAMRYAIRMEVNEAIAESRRYLELNRDTKLKTDPANETAAARERSREEEMERLVSLRKFGMKIYAMVPDAKQKQKPQIPMRKGKPTNDFIVRLHGVDLCTTKISKQGDTISIKGLTGLTEYTQVLKIISRIFRDNYNYKNLKIEIDPNKTKDDRTSDLNVGSMLTEGFGASFIFGQPSHFTLDRDTFASNVRSFQKDSPTDITGKLTKSMRAEISAFLASSATSAPTYNPLTKEEEREMIRLYKEGTPAQKQDAQDHLILSNQRLVRQITGEIVREKGKPSGMEDTEELVNEGNIGLLKALRQYDPSKEERLTTYADQFIKGEILLYYDKYGKGAVTIGARKVRNLIASYATKFIKTFDRKPTPKEIAHGGWVIKDGKRIRIKGLVEVAKLKEQTITTALNQLGTPTTSLSEQAGMFEYGGETVTVSKEAMVESQQPTAEDEMTNEDELPELQMVLIKDNYAKAFTGLTDLQRYIIMNHDLASGPMRMKLKEIAEEKGYDPTTISKMRKAGLEKVLAYINSLNQHTLTLEAFEERSEALEDLNASSKAFPVTTPQPLTTVSDFIKRNIFDNPEKMTSPEMKKMAMAAQQWGGIRHRWWRKIFSLPYTNARKSNDWKKAFRIAIDRITNRDKTSYDLMQIAEDYLTSGMLLKQKGYSKKQIKDAQRRIDRVIIIGDETLRDIIADLQDAIDSEKNEQKKAQLEERLERYNHHRTFLLEDVMSGIKDDNGELIKLNETEWKIYQSALKAEQKLFDKIITHTQDMLLKQYRKQKWYKLLRENWEISLNDEQLLSVGKVLKLASTEEGIEKITRSGIKIKFTELFKKINAEYDKQTASDVKKSMAETYERIFDNVSSQMEALQNILKALNPEMQTKDLNKAVKEMIIAYQRTRPRLRKIRDLRNSWHSWPGFFPRMREKGTMKFKLYKKGFDEDGNETKQEVYSGMFNNLQEGANLVADATQKFGKDGYLGEEYVTDYSHVSDVPENMFQGVSDFNVQAIFDAAIDKMAATGTYYNEQGEEIDVRGEIWDGVFDSIAGQFQARGAAAHARPRQQKLGERAIKGYIEDSLPTILKNHITMISGFLSKQDAAYEYMEMMSGLEDKTRAPELREYINGQLRNDTKLDRISSKLRAFAFLWYLGGMVKSAVVNSTQSFLVGIPVLDGWMRERGIKGSGALMQLKLSRAIAQHYWMLVKDPSKWGDVSLIENPKDINLNYFLKAYLNESIINGSMAAQHMRFIKGEISSLGGKLNKVFDVLAFPFATVEKYNRMTSGAAMFVTAFKHIHSQHPNMSGEDIYEQAAEEANQFINDVHYPIGKHNLPILAQSGDVAGVTIKTLYTFRPFTHNFLLNQFNLLRSARRLLVKQMYGKDQEAMLEEMVRKGLTRAQAEAKMDERIRQEATNDLKTFIHTMALIAMFGGMLALPFLKDLFEFYEKHFGTSPKQWVRNALRGVGGERLEEFGMYGIAGLLGANMSGSLAIGIPFAGDQSSLESVFGVYAGIGKKSMLAAEALTRGDMYRVATNLSPEFVRSPIVALTESDFGKEMFGFRGHATTTKGLPSYSASGEPLSYETGEAAWKFFGFQPTRISKEREIEQSVKRQVIWANDEKRNISETFRINRLEKDPKAMQKMLKSVRELNKDIRSRKVPVPLANVSTIIKNSRQTKNLQKRRELARRLQLETQ